MRLAFLINDFETERDVYTTTRLALAAHRAGHDVMYLTVENFVYDSDETLRLRVRRPPASYTTERTLLAGIKSEDANEEVLPIEALDVLMLRNDPSDDSANRPWAQAAGIVFGLMASRRGVLVLNDPGGLSKAINKVYFQRFPEAVRPKTLITREPSDVRRFIDDHGGDVVLKPFQGSGGESVFVVREDDRANLNQIIETVSSKGYIVVQEYLAEAVGRDTRMFLLNGVPLQADGVYAAFARQSKDEDIRSNMGAGGAAQKAEIGEVELRIAELVRPQLIEDGMFIVGLDIAGGRLLEVNVFSPGGLGSVKELTKVDFAPKVIEAIERKLEFRVSYRRHFSNAILATL